MHQPVFYDPKRRRWKNFRRVIDVTALALTLLVIYFVYSILRGSSLPQLLLPEQRRPYKALKEKESRHPKPRLVERKSKAPATQVPLNSDEGIRGAFYVTWSAASYSSLREHLRQIDLLFPEWLHMLTPDGRLQGETADGVRFELIGKDGALSRVDDKVMPLLRQENAETEVLPLVNNFDGNDWVGAIGGMLNSPAARANFRQQVLRFLASDAYRGLTLDFEDFPVNAQPGYRALLAELEQDLHARNLKLYVAVPARNTDFDYKYVATHADGVILMNYDEHFPGAMAGPIASQDWFVRNLQAALQQVPAVKLLCAISNYGYDWQTRVDKRGRSREKKPGKTTPISVQDAWLRAQESGAEVEFDGDSLNPHFAFLENDVRHEVWFTDGVTAFNQMRVAQRLGINTFAVWRLGSEDRSLWPIFDQPQAAGAEKQLQRVPPGYDVALNGQGDIVVISGRPAVGERHVLLDEAGGLISGESYPRLPLPYELTQYGGEKKQIALSFDDGPDPNWTPKILDALNSRHVKGTFFMIGMQAERYPRLVRRAYAEGHELGNHTWTHPDISNISKRYIQVELNLAERFFAATIGIKPMLFRPPYSVDQEPDTADQVRPLEITQGMGYITIGDKIDPYDWHDNPRRTAEQLTAAVLNATLPPCLPNGPRCGAIVLLHDGGGDRRETVRAVPMIIDALRARGYEIVPVSTLLGRTSAEMMPAISGNERWGARLDRLGFWIYGIINHVIMLIFFVGDVLMSARLLLVGAAAIYDRLRRRVTDTFLTAEYQPPVAVLVPAYNEEKVIERTVRAVLASTYRPLRVIVIDDGSSDRTLEVVRERFAPEIALRRVTVLTKPNSGKADALNFALEHVTEEIFVGIDADTIIHPKAVELLVPHFQNPRLAALAGNAKVGNRVNLWTRWQALEYITSQNFERRAMNVFGAIPVVPGAIGAWRTSYVRAAGGYHHDTVAEDADLTMALLERGYRVEYEDRALAYTEAPSDVHGLMRQRFRWSFGILQSVWKHGGVMRRGGALGWIVLPNILIFQILLPLVSPFIDLMFLFGLIDYGMDKYFHPETANPANLQKLIAFFAAFLVIDFIASAVAFLLERRGGDRRENFWLLWHVWLQRFAYRQVFSLVLVKTLKRALDGRAFAWDKLERTATVQVAHEPEPAASGGPAKR
jgi:cellulose synthase/poly-beta-1,6-N-acetylglucosamine synthase-like glycosyltransferase/peptidoglycan/xylan/chitin deacetylase (PgdA/CDA1 family)/spore germination protein YaaH